MQMVPDCQFSATVDLPLSPTAVQMTGTLTPNYHHRAGTINPSFEEMTGTSTLSMICGPELLSLIHSPDRNSNPLLN